MKLSILRGFLISAILLFSFVSFANGAIRIQKELNDLKATLAEGSRKEAIRTKLLDIVERANHLENLELASNAYFLLGEYFFGLHDLKRASIQYIESQKNSISADLDREAMVNYRLAQICRLKDNLQTSIYYFNRALQKVEPDHIDTFKADIYYKLGITYLGLGQHFSAGYQLNNATLAYRAIGNTKGLLMSRLRRSQLLVSQGEYEAAEALLIEVRKEVNTSENDYVKGLYLMQVGILNIFTQPDKALEPLKMAKLFFDKSDIIEKSEVYTFIIEAYLKLDKTQKALPTIREFENYVADFPYLNRKLIIYDLYYRTFEQRGDLDQANYYLKLVQKAQSQKTEQLETLVSFTESSKAEPSQPFIKKEYLIAGGYIFISLVGSFLIIVSIRSRIQIRQKSKSNVLLEQNNAHLKLNIKDSDQYVMGLSHELKGPLHILTVVSKRLKQTKDKAISQEYLKMLHFINNYMGRLIKVVALSKKIQKPIYNKETLDFKSITRTVSSIYGLLLRDDEFKLLIDEAVPSKLVGDPIRIIQILLSVSEVFNDLKSAQNGNVLELKLFKKEVRDIVVKLVLTTPVSIFPKDSSGATEVAEDLEKFKTLMAKVQKQAEALGATFEQYHSETSSFTFFFSFKSNSSFNYQPVVKTQQSQNRQRLSTTTQENEFKILLVEDNKMNQVIMQKIILSKGFSCETADNGKEAVDKIRKNTFNLVLMDMMMPVMDGIEATTEIRKFNQDIVILALSAVAQSRIVDQLPALGIEKLITKPVEPKTLYAIINSYARNPVTQPR